MMVRAMPDDTPSPGQEAIYDWATEMRKEAERNAEETFAARKNAIRWGRIHGAVHLFLGGSTVIAGALAAASADNKSVSSLAVAAAILAALSTFLNAGKRAADKWALAAGLLGVTKRFRTLARSPKEPTRRDIDALSEQWERLETPPRA
jgi:hypothetical protein